tara:strand:+ start:289 stop:600 length:312 start_codon:yes stop_codon:yes gene_type:complete
MKVYKKEDFEYWYDRSTQCWWAIEIDPKTGYQVKDAHDSYRKDQIIEIVEEQQNKLGQLRAKVGEPDFSSEECEDDLSLKFLEENPDYLMSGRKKNEMVGIYA